MREGEPSHSLFIVSSGRVDVVVEGPPEVLLRVLRRGDVVGELALLRAGTRSASARARRDTERPAGGWPAGHGRRGGQNGPRTRSSSGGETTPGNKNPR